MNLYDLVSQAQDGQAIANLGAVVGLEPAEADQAVQALLPSLSAGLKRNSADETGLRGLMEAVSGGNHLDYESDPGSLGRDATRDDGNGILGHVFGSKDVSRNVAGRAEANTGISAAILKKMLPLLATVVMGALSKRVLGTGLGRSVGKMLGGGILGRLLGSRLLRLVGAGFIAKILFKAFRTAGWTVFRRFLRGRGLASSRSGTDFFGSLLDADGDGSVVDDIFDLATSRR